MIRWTKAFVKIPKWVFFLCVLILITTLVALIFFLAEGVKWQALAGGLLGGLTVYTFDYLSRIRVYRKLEEHEKAGFRRLLRNRHDKKYYGNILKRGKKSVRVVGTSCSRFIRDFLDRDSEEHVLVDILRRRPDLKVCLLVPSQERMNERNRSAFQSVSGQIRGVKEEFAERFQIRRFDDEARHSIVIVDDQLIAGPVFDGERSSYEPAVHVLVESRLGGKYAEYFRSQWDNAIDGESTDSDD